MASSPRIDELRKKFDENPRRYFAPLANEYRKAGDLEQAVFICQEYLPQQPGHMSGHIVYGQTLFEMARHEEAQVVFETALSLDPENLIALRHLGDIARLTGDSNAARVWYQRVLEADPRNEEIAQLMISLLAAPEPASPTPAHSPAYSPAHSPTPVSSIASTPLNVPSVAQVPASVPQDASGGTFVVEKSADESQLSVAPPAAPAAPVLPPEPPPPAHTTSATKAGDGHDFLNLEDFNIGGIPSAPVTAPNELRAARNPAEQEAEEAFEELSIVEAFRAPEEKPAPAPEPELPEAPESSFELGTEDGPFEADPFAIAGSSGEPAIAEPAVAEPTVEEPLVEADSPFVDGLESFEAGVIVDVPEDVPAFETAAFFDPTPDLAATDAALDSGEAPVFESAPIDGGHAGDEVPPSLEELAPAAAAPAFVTETMAELYLRQGHLDAALDIYRQLVEQRPDDAELAERLRAVEDQVYATPAPAAADDAAAAPVYGGPTIREFLVGLASRRTPLAMEAVPEPNYVPAFEDEGAFAPMSEPPRHIQSDETVRGSIDALFSGADTASSDMNAASALQEAFAADGPDNAPLQGMPAHRASSELSLDHVFKGNSPPRPDGDGFSFDQFFAEEMPEGAPNAVAEGSAPTEVTDDIAQFNAWLNGLKKT